MGNIDIGFYLLIIKRRFALLVLTVLAALAVAFAAINILPPSYVATAKILVEAPQIPSTLARSTVSTTAVQQLQILKQQITARSALVSLAQTQQIYGRNIAGTKPPSEEQLADDLLGRITFDQVQIDGDPGQATAVYAISFSADNPQMAAKVANALASMIMQNNQSQRTDRAGRTLQFFDQQVGDLAHQLAAIEDEILAYKNGHRDSLPESLEFRRSQQLNLQERLVSLEREEADLRSRRNTLIAATAGGETLSGKTVLSPEQQMMLDLNRALGQQLTLFREDSPNVVALRQRIAGLQREIVKTSLEGPKDDAKADVPRFGLDLQLKDIDDRLAAIENERRTATVEIASLTRSIAATPTSETALNAMTRRRENIQTQYNAAIAGRAEALTGTQIESRSEGARFSLLDGAAVPERPISPRKKKILAMGGAAGIGLALALVFLLENMNRTVRRPRDLAYYLQSAPLGAIPVIRTARESRSARIRTALAAAAGTVAVPGALAIIHYYYMPLHMLLGMITSNLSLAGAV